MTQDWVEPCRQWKQIKCDTRKIEHDSYGTKRNARARVSLK